MSLNQRFPVDTATSKVLTDGSTPIDDQFVSGIRVNMLGTLLKATSTGGTISQNGLLLTGNVQVVLIDATAGLPANVQWQNGFAFAPTGELCVSTDPVAYFHNGIPRVANGAVAIF